MHKFRTLFKLFSISSVDFARTTFSIKLKHLVNDDRLRCATLHA